MGEWVQFSSVLYKISTPDARKKVAAFEFDNAIAMSPRGAPFCTGSDDWQFKTPYVKEKLHQLYMSGHRIVIFTNRTNMTPWHPECQVRPLFDSFVAAVGIPIDIFVSLGKDPYRKPGLGMWTVFVEKALGGKYPPLSDCFYVGPATVPRFNLHFATHIGIRFLASDTFFAGNLSPPPLIPAPAPQPKQLASHSPPAPLPSPISEKMNACLLALARCTTPAEIIPHLSTLHQLVGSCDPAEKKSLQLPDNLVPTFTAILTLVAPLPPPDKPALPTPSLVPPDVLSQSPSLASLPLESAVLYLVATLLLALANGSPKFANKLSATTFVPLLIPFIHNRVQSLPLIPTPAITLLYRVLCKVNPN
jgi:DNA 3'-phosphatase